MFSFKRKNYYEFIVFNLAYILNKHYVKFCMLENKIIMLVKTNLIKISITFLLSILLLYGCSKEDSTVYKKVEDKFGSEQKVVISTPTSFKIFIDASQSMKGFVIGNDFRNLIGKLVTSFRNTTDVKYYFFDTTLKTLNNYLDLFQPSIYTGYKANFDRLFYEVENEFQKDSNSLFILITDFQFNNFNIYYNTVNSFQNILSSNGYIKFFASTFNFNGLIFPQFTNAKPYSFSGNRPIYIIMIGRYKNAKFIEELADNLLNDFNTITLTKKIPINSEIITLNNTLSKTNIKKSHFKVKKTPFNISIIIESPLFNDWNNFTNADFYISSYYYYRDSLFEKLPEIEIDSLQKGEKLKIYISSKKDLEYEFNIYNIQCIPRSFPEWIDSLNTDNVTDPLSQSNKTIWLKRFFEDLFRPVVDKLVLFEKIIIIEK